MKWVTTKRNPTEGAKRLRTHLTPSLSATVLAEKLGKSQQHIWNWTHGVGRPDRKTRERIEKLTGVPASSWLTDAERTAMARELGVALPARERTA